MQSYLKLKSSVTNLFVDIEAVYPRIKHIIQNIIHLIFICHILRSFGLILTKCCQTLVATSPEIKDISRKWQFYRIFGRFELCSSQFDREQLTLFMHFPVIGESLG